MLINRQEARAMIYGAGLCLSGFTTLYFGIEPTANELQNISGEIGDQQRSIVSNLGVNPDSLADAAKTIGVTWSAPPGRVPFVEGIFAQDLPLACRNPFRDDATDRACQTAQIGQRLRTEFDRSTTSTTLPELRSRERDLSSKFLLQTISGLGLDLMAIYKVKGLVGKAIRDLRQEYVNLILS